MAEIPPLASPPEGSFLQLFYSAYHRYGAQNGISSQVIYIVGFKFKLHLK